jgi:AcrR family transcriptional regulator
MPRFKESERKQVKKETRTRLLEAAVAAFSAQGYERANVDDISRAAGFAKGTIYNYFDSKRDILLALVEEIAAEHITFVTGQVMVSDDPAGRLGQFYESGFEWVIANPARARLLFNTLNGADDGIRQKMFAAYLPMFELVGRQILDAGSEDGPFRPDDSGQMASLLMLIYLGAASQQGPDGRPWVPAGKVTDLVLNGLKNSGQ